MQTKKQLITLGSDGELALKLPGGEVRKLNSREMEVGRAFVYLVIDCSGSMTGHKLEQAKKGSLDFAASALHDGYEVGLISFNSAAFHLCPLVSDLSELANGVNR